MQVVGHIRIIFPSLMLNQFKHKGMVFTASYNSHFCNDVDFYKSLSFVKFQRSATYNHLNCIERSKTYSDMNGGNFGVLYEVDDLITPDVPETNIASAYYKKNWDSIKLILESVDGIITSTDRLKSELAKHTSTKIYSFKNRLCSWLWNQQEWKDNKNSKLKILWAGSQNHFSLKSTGGDFNTELLKFIEKTSKMHDWIFVGACPNELKKNKNIKIYPWQTIFNFGHFLRELNPDIGIAPLEKCTFNDCKSNIKALEFASLGIPGVYGDATPYSKMKYTSNDNFIDNLQKLINDVELRKATWEHDYNILKKELYWDDQYLTEYVNTHLKFYNKTLG